MPPKPFKPPRRPTVTRSSTELRGQDGIDVVKEQDISAVQNRTELLDLEDVSNFDRTALSETGYEDGPSIMNGSESQSKNNSFVTEEVTSTSAPAPKVYSPQVKRGDNEWKVAEKSSPPPTIPARQIKGTGSSPGDTYVSSDSTNNTNTNTSEDIISSYHDRIENTANDSISKYNDYMTEEDSVLSNNTVYG